MLALMLALVALLALQIISLKTVGGNRHSRGTPRAAILTLSARDDQGDAVGAGFLRPGVGNSSPRAVALPSDGPYLHTDGALLLDSGGHPVRLSGLNWFGLETCAFAPEGLGRRSLADLLDQIRVLGFNAIRLPFSDQLLDPQSFPHGINYALNPDLRGLSGLQVMDRLIQGAGARGLRVLLDRHRPSCMAQSELWYTRRYPEARWIADLVRLARRYRHEPAVLGIDLHNEPHGPARWGTGDPATDWRLAAERAGDAVLRTNPHLLIVVQGVESYRNDYYWWGGNLEGAAALPVRLTVPHRLVYEAHDYGAGVYGQGWFSTTDFPRNLPGIWQRHWAYLPEEGIAPVLLGEFGGRNVALPYIPAAVRAGTAVTASLTRAQEGIWQRTLVGYLAQHPAINFMYWTFTPDSADTGGLLTNDWQTANSAKQRLLAGILAAALPVPHAQPAPAPIRVLAASQIILNGQEQDLTLRIVNDGARSLDLKQAELRYWLDAPSSPSAASRQQVTNPSWTSAGVAWASTGLNTVLTKPGRERGYSFVALRFVAAPYSHETLAPYGGTATVVLRVHRLDWAPYPPSRDWSYIQSDVPTAAAHLTLAVDGRPLWGVSPLMAAKSPRP
jgi:endoglucanase